MLVVITLRACRSVLTPDAYQKFAQTLPSSNQPPEPRTWPAHHMHVQVMHFLAAFSARVDDGSKAAFRVRIAALLQRQPGCQHRHAA